MSDSSGQTGMHPQLMLLLELQDLRSQKKELAESDQAEQVEGEHFHMDAKAAAEQLEAKIGEMEELLEPRTRARYDRITPIRDRVVVPVINGVCYGCFVSIPTATAEDRESRADLQACEHCGSFIYILG